MNRVLYICQDMEHARLLAEEHRRAFHAEGVTAGRYETVGGIPEVRTNYEIRYYVPVFVKGLNHETLRHWILDELPNTTFRILYRTPLGDIPTWLFDECESRRIEA